MSSYPFLSYQPIGGGASYVPPTYGPYDEAPFPSQRFDSSSGIEMSEKPFTTPKVQVPDLEKSDEAQPKIETSSLKLMAEKLQRPSESMAFLEMYHKSAIRVEQAAASLKKASVSLGVIAGFVLLCTGFSLLTKESPKPKLGSGVADFTSYPETENFVSDLV
jgi:hypothetical protein